MPGERLANPKREFGWPIVLAVALVGAAHWLSSAHPNPLSWLTVALLVALTGIAVLVPLSLRQRLVLAITLPAAALPWLVYLLAISSALGSRLVWRDAVFTLVGLGLTSATVCVLTYLVARRRSEPTSTTF